MIKYKWCVCDMDGTLLNSDNVISNDNEVALKNLQKMGVEVIIASGRLDLMVKSYIKQLNLKGPIISCNGGLVRNIQTGEVLYSKVMDKNSVKEVTTYCNNNKIEFVIYTSDLVYSTKNNTVGKRYEDRNKFLLQDEQIPIKYIDDKVMKNISDIEAFKVLLVCEKHADILLLEKYFSKYENLTVVSSAKGLLDIMASDISKGNALEILSRKLNVNLDEIMVFGDNYNDMEMFKCAGMPKIGRAHV